MLQGQIQLALLEGLDLPGDLEDGGEHILQYVQHQADQAEQGQHQTDGGNPLHPHDGGRHLLGAVGVQGGPPLDHLVQLSHQSGQIGLDGVLIIGLGPGRAGGHHLLHLAHGLVELLVDGLDLIPKGQNLLVVRPGFPIDPLAQDALGIVRPREAPPGVQGVAQVAGPLVMGGFGGLGPVQQGDCTGIPRLHPVDPDQIEGGYSAEQQNGQKRCGDPIKYHGFNTFSHR